MSNLLNKSSILLTPTAYENGKILSVKPADATGDLDFTRNSSATRVNSQGLIEDMQILSSDLVTNGDFSQEGAELVTNGDFSSDTDWTKQASWSISGGAANYDFLSDAKYIRQTLLSGGFVAGKSYKINFEITSGTAYMNISSNGGGLISLNTYSVGSHSIYVTASASGSDLLIFGRNTSGTAFSIDNVSVKEVGQDWNLGTGWSIVDSVAIASGSVSANISQNSFLTIGSKYEVTYTVLNASTGTQVGLAPNVSTIQNIRTENGTYTEVYEALNSNFYIRNLWNNGVGLSIANIKITEITEDTNLPRIDYTGGVGHWLFEPQSTNLMPNANQYSGNTVYYTVTPNQSSPDGENNATLFIEKTSTSPYSVNSINASIIGGQTYAYSFFVKYAGKQNIPVNATDGVSGYSANIDILNGTVNSGTAEIKDFGNGWFRVSMKRTVAASASNARIQFNFGNQTGDGTSGFYLFGYQIEQQSFATSYIPTNGSTVTRLQDAASGAGSSDLINSTEGVLYAETKVSVHGGAITLSDGSNNNNLIISFNLSSGRIDCNMKAGGAYQFIFNYTTDMSINNKIAVRYKANDFALFVNGIKVLTDTTGITPAINALNKINFSSANTASNHLYGKTKCLAVWKEALTDAELTCLTTI